MPARRDLLKHMLAAGAFPALSPAAAAAAQALPQTAAQTPSAPLKARA